ncbi:MAG: acyl-CoA dehydrogenase [Rhodocyclaceae bacterium]|jgi:butyryl-CoA dehydrogenase|nr:acyl-CoA dehydrogenase [Rhodocyclaceae bacterium]
MTLDINRIRETLDHLLYRWLDVERLTRYPRYAEHDRATFDGVIELCARLAAEKFEPGNRLSDIREPAFDGTRVSLPEETAEACRAYNASGMPAAGQDYAHGGMQLPYIVEMAANSFFSAASIGLKAYSMLTVANANLLMAHGSETQKRVFAVPALEGRYFGTMNLSEPQAGSSLSDIATRAVPDGADFAADPLGPRYRLTGTKMWISGGEHELGENIIHLVLAKVPDEAGRLPPGTRGISLFVVPRLLLDASGAPTGERNDIALAGLNHKLGYRGTVNTLLNYGEGRFPLRAPGGTDGAGAIGYRVGDLGAGLKCMFHMMNEARIQVGLGAAMLGYAGYLASLDYARQRPQGRPTAEGATPAKDASQPPIAIVEHPDVKRMLLAQKAYAEGALAFELYCALLVDEQHGDQPARADEARLLLDLLTPVAKSWPSEWCLEGNSLAIQVLGGYGYTRDFPVEQHWRDNRLNMIHEGTHGIHALDLLGRKVLMKDGEALRILFGRIGATAAAAAAVDGLQPLARQLSAAVEIVALATAEAWRSGSARAALTNATGYLRAFGHMVLAWIWLDLAIVSAQALTAAGTAADFHRGKLAAARYFFAYELPLVAAWLAPVRACDSLCRETATDWL